MLVVRFTHREMESLRQASRQMGIPLSRMVREGLDLYLAQAMHHQLGEHLREKVRKAQLPGEAPTSGG